MAEQRRSRPKKGRPSWFAARSDRVSPWAEVLIELELVRGLAALYVQRETRPAMIRRWNRFVTYGRKIEEELPRHDYSTVSGFDLIQTIDSNNGIRLGIRVCLPRELDDVSDDSAS